MALDKFSAVWVSNSSINDFLSCPRLYYLHNMYKDPKSRNKINLISPALSLGLAVHNTLEGMKNLPIADRIRKDWLSDFEVEWKKVSGLQGGFEKEEIENTFKEKGCEMINRVIINPGPLTKKTVRIPKVDGDMIPNFFLSEKENIILCGLIDWIEYIEADDTLRVIDFKTGKQDEKATSLQLSIYVMLLTALQKRRVSSTAYWYLARHNHPVEIPFPNMEKAEKEILNIALNIKHARMQKNLQCPNGKEGCFACKPYEAILNGKAKYIGLGEFKRDSYYLPSEWNA